MEDGVEERDLVTFESSDRFFALLGQCLALAVPAQLAAGTQVQVQASPAPAPARAAPEVGLPGVRKQAGHLLGQMREILDPYAEQAQTYLLDPYLERMIAPVSATLRTCVRGVHAALRKGDLPDPQSVLALDTLGRIFYLYSRIRGYKTITHFFPHEVEDLRPLVDVLGASASLVSPDSSSPQDQAQTPLSIAWEVRYTLLLWLSLVCMIPFDLRQFDRPGQTSTVEQISSLVRAYIGVTGIEREASVVLVGRLYQRPETRDALHAFLTWSSSSLGPSGGASIYLRTGILFSLCELLKVLEPQRVADLMPLFQEVLTSVEESRESQHGVDPSNAQIGKAYTKLIGRLALKQLPPRPRRRRHIRALGSADAPAPAPAPDPDPLEFDEGEADVPEEVEGYLGELLDSLSHESSQVRSSAAKGVARISERLPDSFVVQVLDSVLALFSDNSLRLPDGSIDMNAASEASWQGACLALAEMARRDLLSTARTTAEEDAVTWVQRALMFDVRRGGRGVGTAVRDAACYVLWAMARAHDVQSIGPHIEGPEGTAAALVCAACCDREVSIRRAASAAFQEAAGRLGILPHGLDVIRIADFLAVGVRRNCFLTVLPSVAQYEPYQTALLSHLQSTTLAHWDAAMRDLAAQALALVVRINPSALLPGAIEGTSRETRDPILQHGRLLALASLAPIAREELPPSQRVKSIECALRCRPLLSSTSSGRQMFEAVCALLSQSMDSEVYDFLWHGGEPGRTLLAQVAAVAKQALSRPEPGLQWAAVDALKALTAAAASVPAAEVGSAPCLFQECRQGWAKMEPAEQAGWSKALGALTFAPHDREVEQDPPAWEVTHFLLDVLTPSSAYHTQVVEARRDASGSVVQVLDTNWRKAKTSSPPPLPCDGDQEGAGRQVDTAFDALVGRIIDTLVQGTEDYSTDRRGDVGSWVRSASMSALGRLYRFLSLSARGRGRGLGLALDRATTVEGALLKQMGERNDAVRGNGARALVDVVRAVQSCSSVNSSKIEAEAESSSPLTRLVQEIEAARVEMCEASWLFPRMAPLLSNESLGLSVLEGLLVSVGQGKASYNNDAVTCIQTWVQSGTETDTNTEESRMRAVLSLIQATAKANLSKNKIIVPALRLFSALLRARGARGDAPLSELVEPLQSVGQTCMRALSKVRNVVRLDASRDVCIELLRVSTPAYRLTLIKHVAWFLSHPDPGLRASTSEGLTLALDDLLDSQLALLDADADADADAGAEGDGEGKGGQHVGPEAIEEAHDECENILLSTPWTSLQDAKLAASQVETCLRTMLLPPQLM